MKQNLSLEAQQKLEFKRVYDRVPGWIFRCLNDDAWTMTRTNSRIEKILGYTEEAFAAEKNNSISAVIPEPYRTQVRAYTIQTMERGHGAMHSYVTPVVRKDGSYCWLNVELYYDDAENGGQWYVSCADITEIKKKYDEELSYQDAVNDRDILLKTRADITKDEVESIYTVPVFTLSDQARSFSGGVKQLAARAYDETEKEKICYQLSEECMRQSLDEGGNYTFEYKRRDKKNHPAWAQVYVRAFLHPESKDLIAFVYLKDINEERKTNDILNKASTISRETLALIYLNSDEIEFIKRYDEFNEINLDDELSYSKNIEIFANHYLSEELREEAKRTFSIESIREHLKQEEIYECIYGIGKEQEEYKRWQYAYFDKKNGIVIYKRTDITDTIRKQQEQNQQLKTALVETEKASRAKTDFLSRMSHELRTPMNGIAGYTTLLQNELESSAVDFNILKEYTVEIRKANGYLLHVLSETLDAQAVNTGRIAVNPEITNITELIKSVVKLAREEARTRKIKFSYQRLNQIGTFCYCDKIRLEQVIMNLLNNALKFTSSGGSVQMSVEVNRDTDPENWMTLVIGDNGIGMSHEFVQEKLYQPFTQEESGLTSRYAGAGLGLVVTREIIARMGGTIDCESEKNIGTKFTVRIPLTYIPEEDVPEELKVKKRYPTYELPGIHVLMCEDNPMNQDLLKQILLKMKCKVTVADNGKTGLDEFQNSLPGDYDIVLMDIRMPEMDGLEATRRIRSLSRTDAKAVPILAVSANAFKEDVENSLAAGINEHLAKPVDIGILYEKIKIYCKDRLQSGICAS